MNVWIEGSGRYPSKSESQLYWIERLASPARHWMAFFRAAIGHFKSCGEARPSIEEAQADADAHLEGLKTKAAATV